MRTMRGRRVDKRIQKKRESVEGHRGRLLRKHTLRWRAWRPGRALRRNPHQHFGTGGEPHGLLQGTTITHIARSLSIKERRSLPHVSQLVQARQAGLERRSKGHASF